MSNYVLVTGGAGFIGSHLTEFFGKKKLKVIVVDNFSSGHLDNLENIKNKITYMKMLIFQILKKWKLYSKNLKFIQFFI